MNSHVITPEEKCLDLKCPEHCCSIPLFDNHYHTYCCDKNEYKMHFLPFRHGLLMEDMSYPDHPYLITDDIHLPPTKEIHEYQNTNRNYTNFNARSGQLSEPRALGWNYTGITSGVITLLLFLIVIFIIFYIFRLWKKKLGRSRQYNRGEPNREMVVYRTTPLPQAQTHPCTCALARNNESVVQAIPDEERIRFPPPYSQDKVLRSGCSDDASINIDATTSQEIAIATEIQQNNQEPPSYSGLEPSKSLLVDITTSRT